MLAVEDDIALDSAIAESLEEATDMAIAEALEEASDGEAPAVEFDEPRARPDWKERFASDIVDSDAEVEEAHDPWGYPKA